MSSTRCPHGHCIPCNIKLRINCWVIPQHSNHYSSTSVTFYTWKKHEGEIFLSKVSHHKLPLGTWCTSNNNNDDHMESISKAIVINHSRHVSVNKVMKWVPGSLVVFYFVCILTVMSSDLQSSSSRFQSEGTASYEGSVASNERILGALGTQQETSFPFWTPGAWTCISWGPASLEGSNG